MANKDVDWVLIRMLLDVCDLDDLFKLQRLVGYSIDVLINDKEGV